MTEPTVTKEDVKLFTEFEDGLYAWLKNDFNISRPPTDVNPGQKNHHARREQNKKLAKDDTYMTGKVVVDAIEDGIKDKHRADNKQFRALRRDKLDNREKYRDSVAKEKQEWAEKRLEAIKNIAKIDPDTFDKEKHFGGNEDALESFKALYKQGQDLEQELLDAYGLDSIDDLTVEQFKAYEKAIDKQTQALYQTPAYGQKIAEKHEAELKEYNATQLRTYTENKEKYEAYTTAKTDATPKDLTFNDDLTEKQKIGVAQGILSQLGYADDVGGVTNTLNDQTQTALDKFAKEFKVETGEDKKLSTDEFIDHIKKTLQDPTHPDNQALFNKLFESVRDTHKDNTFDPEKIDEVKKRYKTFAGNSDPNTLDIQEFYLLLGLQNPLIDPASLNQSATETTYKDPSDSQIDGDFGVQTNANGEQALKTLQAAYEFNKNYPKPVDNPGAEPPPKSLALEGYKPYEAPEAVSFLKHTLDFMKENDDTTYGYGTTKRMFFYSDMDRAEKENLDPGQAESGFGGSLRFKKGNFSFEDMKHVQLKDGKYVEGEQIDPDNMVRSLEDMGKSFANSFAAHEGYRDDMTNEEFNQFMMQRCPELKEVAQMNGNGALGYKELGAYFLATQMDFKTDEDGKLKSSQVQLTGEIKSKYSKTNALAITRQIFIDNAELFGLDPKHLAAGMKDNREVYLGFDPGANQGKLSDKFNHRASAVYHLNMATGNHFAELNVKDADHVMRIFDVAPQGYREYDSEEPGQNPPKEGDIIFIGEGKDRRIACVGKIVEGKDGAPPHYLILGDDGKALYDVTPDQINGIGNIEALKGSKAYEDDFFRKNGKFDPNKKPEETDVKKTVTAMNGQNNESTEILLKAADENQDVKVQAVGGLPKPQ